MNPSGKSRSGVNAALSRGLSAAALLALTLFGAGAGMHDAFAQTPASTPAGSTGQQGASDLAPAKTGQAGTDLSPEQLLAKARPFVAAIEQASGSISRQLQTARKERDVVRVLCLNDKLNQVDVALGSARDRLGSLRGAVERADAGRAKHEYTVLEVLGERVRILVNESNQCVGEETGFVGDAQVSVSVDPDMATGSTTFDANSNDPPPPPSLTSPIE